jgi:hypothetical protein
VYSHPTAELALHGGTSLICRDWLPYFLIDLADGVSNPDSTTFCGILDFFLLSFCFVLFYFIYLHARFNEFTKPMILCPGIQVD